MALRSLAASLLLAALLAACGGPAPQEPERPFQVTPAPATPGPSTFGTPQAGYPAPGAAPDAPAQGGYPAPGAAPGAAASDAYPAPGAAAEDTFGRAETALAGVEAAESVAQSDFSPEARLIAVMPSRVMIGNLGGPPVQLGWFYKFKTEGSPREFIVQVVDGVVTGAVETEPIQEPQPAELPIALDQVAVDSDLVYEQLEQRAGELGVSVTDAREFDLELINLDGAAGPVWSVFDPNGTRWLFSLDAGSGDDAPNPRG